ncbi:MAG: glutamate formimidoyltransferase [Chloroflexota bacterium]
MEHLFECVPNISEARDVAVLDAVERAIVTTGEAWLLDRSSDPDHARSVFTVAGSRTGTRAAMESLVEVSIERIDLRRHRGQHPRIGAVDVVPFVPLGDTSMAECVALARAFAAQIAERHRLPVFLYGEAALRSERRLLATVRQPRFEGLATAMAAPGGAPDFGPSQPHSTAGATAVGARPFLIAYNIQLDSADIAVARRIAARVRERDGGLPAVQALGLALESRGGVQVSMNILDHDRTPLWRVWEAVGAEAVADGVAVLGSELIGLAPLAALTAVADHIGSPPGRDLNERLGEAATWLRIVGFRPDMALELRLAGAREGGAPR